MTLRLTKWTALFLVAGILLAPSLEIFGAAAAGSGAAFFRSKTVRLVVGYAPGGGYDSYARMIAPHLQEKLGTTVIVVNEPGGGGFNALINLMRQPGEGLNILLLNGEAAVLSTLVNESAARFDLRDLTYLGRVSYENRTLVARKGTPFDNVSGFLKPTKPVFFGAGGRIDSMGDPASILCDALSIPCKLVTGFQGAPDAALALERGEVDAIVTSESQTAHLIQSHPLVAVAILSPHKASLLRGVPSVFDLVKLSPAKSKWLRFRADVADFGRTLTVPSDTPADHVTVLENAVTAVLTDASLEGEGARTNRPIAYAAPSVCKRIVNDILAEADQKGRATIKKLLLNAY
jgi:tripartite-type tricarboxylate transporter receptor subunit TctC